MNNEKRKVDVGKHNLISNNLNKCCLELDINLIQLKHWGVLICDRLNLHNALFSNNTTDKIEAIEGGFENLKKNNISLQNTINEIHAKLNEVQATVKMMYSIMNQNNKKCSVQEKVC